MAETKYMESHEYIRLDGDVGVVGISKYAQEQLGDVVFVELPETGKTVSKGDEAAVVESVKAASEVYAPVSGEIVEANSELEANPGLVNEDPEGKAWFMKIKLSDKGELDTLMDADAYDKFVEEQG
ncbi:MAG: glycine cleavage system protein GcvH [Hyphomicrobiaceae bacterium]|nr:glycine cleavage system protein GcvH [Hyphomicrobiaceae bacterium]